MHLTSGAACPQCFSTLYYRKYTVWHFLIALFLFPVGLLFLLAPVQRCENGHSYGLGKWIINIIIGTLIVILMLVALVVYAFMRHAGTNELSDRQASTLPEAVVTPIVQATTAAELPSGEIAAGAVQQFYGLWDAQRLPEAYQLLSNRYRVEHPYGAWEKSHEGVVHISVQTRPTEDPLTVAVVVKSTDRTNGGGTTDSEYHGTWSAIHEAGAVKLDRVELSQTR